MTRGKSQLCSFVCVRIKPLVIVRRPAYIVVMPADNIIYVTATKSVTTSAPAKRGVAIFVRRSKLTAGIFWREGIQWRRVRQLIFAGVDDG